VYSGFPVNTKNNISKIPIGLGMLDEEPLREYPTSKELFIYFIVFIYLLILQASCVL